MMRGPCIGQSPTCSASHSPQSVGKFISEYNWHTVKDWPHLHPNRWKNWAQLTEEVILVRHLQVAVVFFGDVPPRVSWFLHLTHLPYHGCYCFPAVIIWGKNPIFKLQIFWAFVCVYYKCECECVLQVLLQVWVWVCITSVCMYYKSVCVTSVSVCIMSITSVCVYYKCECVYYNCVCITNVWVCVITTPHTV